MVKEANMQILLMHHFHYHQGGGGGGTGVEQEMLQYFCKEQCTLPYNEAKLLSLLHFRYINHRREVNITAAIFFFKL